MSLSLRSDSPNLGSSLATNRLSELLLGRRGQWQRLAYPALWTVNVFSLIWLSWLAYNEPFFFAETQQAIDWGHRIDSVVATTLAFATGLGLLGMSWFGPKHARSLISTIAIVTACCVWLSAVSYWPSLAWAGKLHRMHNDLAAFDSVAATLRQHWPTTDGTDEILGAYMAYPIGRPSVLIMLTLPDIDGIDASVIAVERGDDGQLRFQLAGRERGDWLEWHPERSVPTSFVGGIRELYELERYDQIAPHWYLVTYHTSA